MTMSANVRAVNADQGQLHFSVFAGLLQQSLDYLLQNAVLLVIPEAMVGALIGRVTGRFIHRTRNPGIVCEFLYQPAQPHSNAAQALPQQPFVPRPQTRPTSNAPYNSWLTFGIVYANSDRDVKPLSPNRVNSPSYPRTLYR